MLAGDFNLPGWKWHGPYVGPCAYPALHHQFGEIISNHGLTQLVEEPTRQANTLDLIFISNPTLVNSVKVVPGISDHNCPIADIDMRPSRRRQPKRKVPVYKKADWEGFAEHMQHVADDICSKSATASVQDLWQLFKTGIEEGTQTFIPHKMLKKKQDCPWITGGIKKLIKKRDRLHKKENKIRKQKMPVPLPLEEKLLGLKRLIQSEARKAYLGHLETIFTSDGSNEYEGMKRFWKFVKNNPEHACQLSRFYRNCPDFLHF